MSEPAGSFRVAKEGFTVPHDIGCACPPCVARRREQAKQPEFRAIIDQKCALLSPTNAALLRKAFGL